MPVSAILVAALALSSAEAELKVRLPGVFAKAAEHYKVLDAAATPLRNGRKDGVPQIPHGYVAANGGNKSAYDMRDIYWWTSGHFPGSLWLLYEATGDEFFRKRGEEWMKLLEPVKHYSGIHDTGFMMYCSYGTARRILKTEEYDDILVETSKSLCKRYNKKLGLIRSWGNIGDNDHFLVIPDNMMNLEMLLAASKMKNGSREFAEIAMSHADKSMKNHFRDDGGCYHVLDYDQRDGFLGAVQEIRRGQGRSCRTAWARGQAWGIYGFTMMYRATGHRRYLDFARKLADYAINHPDMPEDGVPYWDFGAPGEERDSSAAAVMASALIELSQYVGDKKYRAFAVKQLTALCSPEYFSKGDEIGHFLLKHGVGHKPAGREIDTPLDYGDYYFLEALLRFRELKNREK